MSLPRLNTIDKDVEQFASERQMQLIELHKFKLGILTSGLLALNALESMYQVLLSSDHQTKSQKEADDFIKSISSFRAKLILHLKRKEAQAPSEAVQDPQFIELVGEMDALVYKFYKFKSDLGRSG